MCKSIIRSALLAVLLPGLIVPGAALAGGGERGCSNIGTWIGIAGPDDMSPSGWITTVIGKSNNAGINVIEYPNYDATLGIDQEPFNLAVGISNSRGNWVRTGGNTFDYTFTGFALDEANNPVYISKISGQVTIYGDCQFQYITAFLDAFLPDQNPFTDVPINTEPIPLGVFYGYRASVDLPFWLSIKTTRLAPASAGAFSRASGGQRVVHVPGKTAVKGATGFHDGARRAI